ncbi:uncharacterized protein LOC106671890 [Cimex lectularius]|uniref:Uncharacterized protein n=1 Tax=Cimex lectularius TaxID=79782 RepID=A0A8I6S857_CIMLE|nr:uncharacterized protein LOC106671890 [Cimex lectularius]
MLTPVYDFLSLLYAIFLGEDPTAEDYLLLVGTIVAFVAFILWCCFPVVPKDPQSPKQYDWQGHYTQYKKHDSPHPG